MYASANQVYMAGLMTAPMVVIDLVVMRGMARKCGPPPVRGPEHHMAWRDAERRVSRWCYGRLSLRGTP